MSGKVNVQSKLRNEEFRRVSIQLFECLLDCAGDYCDLELMAERAVDAAEAIERALIQRGRFNARSR